MLMQSLYCISVNNYFSWPKDIVDGHKCSIVRSGCLVERTILYGDLQEDPLW